ncbi:hypothetical protein SAMN04488057_102278 [Cyclobacterium lianum]|uniref:SPOR domain-containing protein n=1 Tax=Cyclobacterium lianum TaxID=388280 RepID=A0A1M7K3I8_9BACT|nr:SPOR domain-containing protein [Cyclobacterium lianum]SHM59836.1 hypothetical protein SAMN04488057_102278 [Cyclobacterium lianum]
MALFKRFFVLGLAALLFNCSPKSMGELSRDEYSNWKDRKKNMSPSEFKALVESREEMSGKLEDLSEKEAYLHEVIERKDNEISRLTGQISKINNQMEAAMRDSGETASDKWEEGVVFKVQLAAFDDYDLRNLTENGSDLEIIDQDGYIKYILGRFRDYKMADMLKKKLRKVGVQEAWIVPYKDGKRVPLKEVLTEVVE